MIFRAMCSGYSHEFPDRRQDETVVYIDAANRDEARQRLPEMLAAVWQLPAESIEVWNLGRVSAAGGSLRCRSSPRTGALRDRR